MRQTYSTGFGASDKRRRGFTTCFLFIAAFSFAIFPGWAFGQGYTQTNLVSDGNSGSVVAPTTDPNLINAWGLVQSFPTATSPGTPFWISDQGTNVSTLYTPSGTKLGLTVSIPTVSGGPNGPTGIVFNGGTGFDVTNAAGTTSKSIFMFADLNGGVYGWNGGKGNTMASLGVNISSAHLTGLAINSGGSDIWVSNFAPGGGVTEFDSTWASVGTLTPPSSLPAGYEPYNVTDISGTLFVAYEPINTTPGPSLGHPIQGLGNGFIAEFGEDGTLKGSFTDIHLDDPWGVALAPSAGFGQFSGDLLVGNFGNGVINAYDPMTDAFAGTLEFPDGTAITNGGLWSLMFGTGGAKSSPTTLYITAGPGDETHGEFAAINSVPEPASLLLFGGGLIVLALAFHRKRAALRG